MTNDRDYVKLDRLGLKVERLQCSGGPFRYVCYQVSFGANWHFCSSDWTVSRRVEGNHWKTVTPAFRCNLCHRWTLGCAKHWFCGTCPQCEAWDSLECEECKERDE